MAISPYKNVIAMHVFKRSITSSKQIIVNAKVPQTFSPMKYCFETINSDIQMLVSYFLEKLAQNLTWLGKKW